MSARANTSVVAPGHSFAIREVCKREKVHPRTIERISKLPLTYRGIEYGVLHVASRNKEYTITNLDLVLGAYTGK